MRDYPPDDPADGTSIERISDAAIASTMTLPILNLVAPEPRGPPAPSAQDADWAGGALLPLRQMIGPDGPAR